MRPLQLSVPAVAALLALSAVPADAGTPGSRGAAPVEVALIADTPYGDAQRQQFPALVEAIDADPQVRMVLPPPGQVDPLGPPTPAAPAAGRSRAQRPAEQAAAG